MVDNRDIIFLPFFNSYANSIAWSWFNIRLCAGGWCDDECRHLHWASDHVVSVLSCKLFTRASPNSHLAVHHTSYRVSHNWVLTLFCLFSRLPMLIQRFILPFFNSPGDDDSKTHLTFLPISKIDQVTEQNVEQPWFRYNLDKPCMYQNNNI